MLDVREHVEKTLRSVKNFLSEIVFPSIDPKKWVSFLSGVKNFRQVANGPFFIEDFVGIREVIPVVPRVSFDFEALPLSNSQKSKIRK